MFSRNAYEFNNILFRIIYVKKKRIHVRVTLVSGYLKVSYFFTFPAFWNVIINSSFRFLQKQMSAI